MGEERLDEGLDLRVDSEADVRAAAQLLRVRIHLNGRGVRQELVVGEVGAQQDQHVGVVHALGGCAVAQQARHAHVEGVVVLDEVLAAQRVADRSLERVRQGDDLVMGALDARAGEDRDLVSLVEEGCGLFNVGGVGSQRRGARGRVGGNVLDGLEVRDVAGQGDDRDAAQADRVADRRVHRAWRLCRGGNELVVDRALLENAVRVGLLEVHRADLHARDVRGNGQDGCSRAVRVVQAVDEVQVARAARTRTHGKLAGELSFGRCSERRRLLVAHVDPVDATLLRAAGLAHGVNDGVKRVTDNAVDTVDSSVNELSHDLFRDVHAISFMSLAVNCSNNNRHDQGPMSLRRDRRIKAKCRWKRPAFLR